jgi:hypothetical protein
MRLRSSSSDGAVAEPHGTPPRRVADVDELAAILGEGGA